MEIERINTVIHELTTIGQSCRSYYKLLDNPSYDANKGKIKQICSKMAKNCLIIRNIIIEAIKEEEDVKQTGSVDSVKPIGGIRDSSSGN